MESLMFKNTTQ